MQVQISDAKNKLRSAEDYRQLVGSFFEQTVADVYEGYQRELHRANAMDFDDLLFRAVNLLELFQEVRDRYTNAFRCILVDEYQDTNQAQYRWLQLLPPSTATSRWSATTRSRSTASAARTSRTSSTSRTTTSTRTVVKLEQNYRSTQMILDRGERGDREQPRRRRSSTLWTDIGEGDPIKVRELADEHAEARFVAAEIERLVDEGVVAPSSPSSTGRTRSRGCWRTCSCARRSATR